MFYSVFQNYVVENLIKIQVCWPASLRITKLIIHALNHITEETGHYFLKVTIKNFNCDSLIKSKQQGTRNLIWLIRLCILTRKYMNKFTLTVHLSWFFLFNEARSNYLYPRWYVNFYLVFILSYQLFNIKNKSLPPQYF